MTDEAFSFSRGFFAQCWRFFISWYIPGTNVSPAGLAIGVVVFVLIINFIRQNSSFITGGDS